MYAPFPSQQYRSLQAHHIHVRFFQVLRTLQSKAYCTAHISCANGSVPDCSRLVGGWGGAALFVPVATSATSRLTLRAAVMQCILGFLMISLSAMHDFFHSGSEAEAHSGCGVVTD